MSRLLIVSADGHAGAPGEAYLPYMDKAFRDECYGRLLEDDRRFFGSGMSVCILRPEAVAEIDDRDAIRSGGGRGSWDIKARIAEMDAEGIAAEILFPGTHAGLTPFHDIASGACSAAYRDAGARAYNRWLVDHIGDEGKGRVFGIVYPGSAHDMDALVAEMKWAKEQGFVGVNCPGGVADPELKPLFDPHWDRFWAAAVDLDLPVTIHAGFRAEQGPFLDLGEAVTNHLLKKNITPIGRFDFTSDVMQGFVGGTDAFAEMTFGPLQAMWEIIIGGVFDRFPKLKIVPTEIHIDWAPPLFAELDRRFAAGDFSIKKTPSDYWRSNFFAGATNINPAEVALRYEIGVDRIVFGRDYPHPESTWPNTWNWLRVVFKDVAEDEVRMILGANAINCYNLDRTFLDSIAAKIGPEVSDILGDHRVPDVYVRSFNERSDFLRAPYSLDKAAMHKMLDADLEKAKAFEPAI